MTYKKLQLAVDLFSANQFWVQQRKVRFNFSWKLAYEENVDCVPNFQFNCEERETQRETERKRKRESNRDREKVFATLMENCFWPRKDICRV